MIFFCIPFVAALIYVRMQPTYFTVRMGHTECFLLTTLRIVSVHGNRVSFLCGRAFPTEREEVGCTL